MKIVVNTRLLIKNKLEGIGWFAYETLSRITKEHPDIDFIFLFDRPFHPDFLFAKNITPVVLSPQARHPILWYLWFELSVKNYLSKTKPDLFLSPDGYIPLNAPCKTLSVIHDIAYEHYPETIPWLAKKYYSHYFPKFANEATRIATVSDFSKKDIAKYYKASPDKIDVVWNGLNSYFHPSSLDEIHTVKSKFTNDKDYFVFIGGLYPRKNLIRLMDAFAIFKLQTASDLKLVLIGKQNFHKDEILEHAKKNPFKHDIIFTGRLDDMNDVNTLLSGAIAMTYLSIFEGFGIPCLEAMACATPVIASNTSSIPEVCTDAAFYANPFDTQDIANAMIHLYQNTDLQNELKKKGLERIKYFNWDKTANLLWDSILTTIQR